MKASYDRLISKYGIEFDHDWHWWTKNQVAVMTTSPIMRLIKSKINTFFRK
jgi:hypothetical protein